MLHFYPLSQVLGWIDVVCQKLRNHFPLSNLNEFFHEKFQFFGGRLYALFIYLQFVEDTSEDELMVFLGYPLSLDWLLHVIVIELQLFQFIPELLQLDLISLFERFGVVDIRHKLVILHLGVLIVEPLLLELFLEGIIHLPQLLVFPFLDVIVELRGILHHLPHSHSLPILHWEVLDRLDQGVLKLLSVRSHLGLISISMKFLDFALLFLSKCYPSISVSLQLVFVLLIGIHFLLRYLLFLPCQFVLQWRHLHYGTPWRCLLTFLGQLVGIGGGLAKTYWPEWVEGVCWRVLFECAHCFLQSVGNW